MSDNNDLEMNDIGNAGETGFDESLEPVQAFAPAAEPEPVAAVPVETPIEAIPVAAPVEAPIEAVPVAAPVEAAPVFTPEKSEYEEKVEAANASVAAGTAAAVASDKGAKPAKAAKKNARKQEKAAKEQALKDQCPKQYKPVGVSKYFWLSFFFAIPLVGFILSIIFSIVPRNRNVKNFSRAVFVWFIIGIILTLIGLVVAMFVNESLVGDLAIAFGNFFETVMSAFGF